ncbi:MAG: carboxypeptidase-like regulatory domain-containing protein [Fusobacterium sp. JB019]|nr:carboxypeptidase-like regulatory domain-containing protein [Fusobacterium sp. JB019]
MNSFNSVYFRIFLFLFLTVNSFCDKFKIDFEFDIATGYIYYEENNPFFFNDSKASLNLEKGNYTFLFSDKYQNSLKKKIFISKNKKIFISFLNNKKIKGKILDENFNPIKLCNIKIKNKLTKQKSSTTSDDFGKFNIPYTDGINIITINKIGYSSKIIMQDFSNHDSNNIYILNKNFYLFSGIVTNDIYPINNLPIYLFSKKGKLLNKTTTNINGEFFLNNINSNTFYIFIPETKLYKTYKSSFFNIDKSIEEFRINIKKR